MLKTSNTKSAKPKKAGAGVGSNSKARRKLDKSGIDDVEVDGGEVRDNEIGKKSRKMFKSKNLFKSKKTIESDFLIPKARLTFAKLRQVFVKALIFNYFDLEYHI